MGKKEGGELKRISLWIVCGLTLLLSACGAAPRIVVTTTAPAVTPTPAAVQTPAPSAVPTPEPTPTAKPVTGTITVRAGDTLEHDIIPQLSAVFSLSGEQVKDALARAQSRLVSGALTGFRRMEGVIVPGRYDVTDETLEDMIAVWASAAENRYDGLLAACADANGLDAWERLTLASVVDWECLGSPFQTQAAAVLLNRLADGGKLQCCATVEYALGYGRPYLTSADITVDSAYNTYAHKGLPPGPICVVDEASLAAAIGKPADENVYFFFYDYAPQTMQFFSDYGAFKQSATVSKQLFLDTFDIGKNDKLCRREVFGVDRPASSPR